jgi:hypothetical protein
MGDGFGVDTGALREYGDSLSAKSDQAREILDLVGQADVGDKSWGIVGLFVKSHYSTMLTDLQDLLHGMQDGLLTGSTRRRTPRTRTTLWNRTSSASCRTG